MSRMHTFEEKGGRANMLHKNSECEPYTEYEHICEIFHKS